MSDASAAAGPKDSDVQAALREYLERVDRGEVVDRETFLSQHSEIAEKLRSFIAAEEQLRRLAGAERVDRSTKSFALDGQETMAPRAGTGRSGESGTSGLKQEFGRYRILKPLGKGAMGMVYLAEDTQLQRQVALKTPHFEYEPTADLLERFYREARSAATLRHPNICPVYDVGQIEGTHYISMAYIEGHPLSAFIRSDKPQSERQILIIVRKLAQALEEAHTHGIVHRDLKPANIMVDKRNEPIIMDFGLARQLQREEKVRITQSGMLIGTPAYMSPEQIDGEPGKVGPASDQYSLGVILYELLTGQLPFRGSLSTVMAQILTKGPTPPSQLRPDLDLRIEALCLKVMAKDSANRFASPAAVAEELALILRTPKERQTAPTALKPPGTKPTAATPAAADANVATSGVRQSVARKSLVAPSAMKSLATKDLDSLDELARKCLARHDYDQVIQIVERIPESKRTAGLTAVLATARTKADEISFLLCEIDEAVRFKDRATVLKKADELLKLKPGHHRALQAKEEFTGFGKGGAARLGPLETFTRPWTEGGWIPWSVFAFGLAVAGVVYAIVVIQLGKTAVVIDIQDPDISVAIADKGKKIEIITGPRESKIEVEPGEQELKITYAGLEAQTQRFELKSGQKRRVTVSLVDKKLVVKLDQESLPLIDESEKAGPGKPDGKPQPAEPVKIAAAPSKGPPPEPKRPAVTPPAAPAIVTVMPASAGGFVPLFNGRDLSGWKTHPSQPGNWRVENGVLIGSGADASHLYTERDDYTDFHLRVEARIAAHGNSGLDFRTTFGPQWPANAPKFPFTYEAQIDNDNHAAKTGSLFVVDGGGGSGSAVVRVRNSRIRPGEWFTMEVIARGEHIEIKLNGKKVASRDDSHFAKGHIAIQQLEPQTIVEFRKVEIEELDSTAPDQSAESSAQLPPTPGFISLFNGRDLTGWQTRSGESPDWHVEHGILTGGLPGGSSFLYSERGNYKDFHLRVEARIKDDAYTELWIRAPKPADGESAIPKLGYKIEMREPADAKKNRTGSIWAIGRKDGHITLNGFGRHDRVVQPGEWFTLEVIAKGSRTVILVNGKGPTNNRWNQRDTYRSGAHLAFEQNRDSPPVEIRRVEIQEFGASTKRADDSSQSGPSSTKGTNLLVNGSFEEGSSPGDFQSYDPGSKAIPGWTVTRGQIDLLGSKKSAEGQNSVDLHGSPGYGGIKQKFKTTKDHRYRVTFALAVNPEATHPVKKMGASAANTAVVFTTDTQSKWWDQLHWATKTLDFTATADATTLEFYTLDHSDPVAGPLIDQVRVIELAEK